MERKNFGAYLKGLYKSCNIIACLIAGVLIGAVGYLLEKTNAIEFVSRVKIGYKLAVILPFAIGVLALVVAIIKGLFSKKIATADAVAVTGISVSIIWFIFSMIAIDTSSFVAKIITFAVVFVLTVIIFAIRVNQFDGSSVAHGDVPPANATFVTYYKALFKKYIAFVIIFAVALIVGLLLMDKANFVTSLFSEKNIGFVAIILGLIGLMFVSLFVARIKDRDIDFIDVLLFAMLFAGLALIVLFFTVGPKTKLLVGSSAVFTIIVSLLLTVIAVKSTHIETKAEKEEYAHAKSGVKAYFTSLKNHVNLLALVGVSVIVASGMAYLLLSGTASHLINRLKLENRREFTIAVLAVAVFIFTLMFADVSLHRVETMDAIMFATAISSIFALVVDQIIMGQSFIVGGLMFTATAVLSIAFIALRTIFVKYIPQTEEVKAVAPVAIEEKKSVQEEKAVEEETATTVSPELTLVEEEIPVKLKRVNVKKSFETYLRTGDEQLKENYSAIKNELLSYGVHARFTNARENFSKKGLSMSKVDPEKNLRLQAKLLIRGKFLKLYLNVDPSLIDAKYYRTKDVSDKMPDQPTYIKVRSKLSLKRALELINLLAEKEGFTKKKKFEAVDYKAQFTDENLSYMQKLGYDYMVKEEVTYQEVLQYKEEWAERVIKTKIVSDAERYIYDEIELKHLEKEYEDGAVVDLESLRAKGLIKINCNHLTVLPSEKLSKKLYIEANAIDLKTAQMVIIAGGEVTKLIFD